MIISIMTLKAVDFTALVFFFLYLDNKLGVLCVNCLPYLVRIFHTFGTKHHYLAYLSMCYGVFKSYMGEIIEFD